MHELQTRTHSAWCRYIHKDCGKLTVQQTQMLAPFKPQCVIQKAALGHVEYARCQLKSLGVDVGTHLFGITAMGGNLPCTNGIPGLPWLKP